MGEREVVRVVYVRNAEAGSAAAFAIDGRDYETDEAVRAAVIDAWDELENRGLVAEFETRPAGERPDWLPTWEQYRERLEAVGPQGGDSG